MKKLFLLAAVLFVGLGLKAQSNAFENVVISPDSLYYSGGGCCPTINFILIENMSDETMIINGMHSDAFYVECFYKDINVTEEGLFIAPGESAEISVSVGPLETGDIEGTMVIDTDFGEYVIYLNYEETYGLEESSARVEIYPNPAKDFVTIGCQGQQSIKVFNAVGQIIDEWVAEGDLVTISTSKYANGVYFVQVGDTQVRRLVILH
ncbi:MAG: T9SS type A sorting domain-containing protein [Bacteroidales bacterium]|nr:T9SS type A sorting domain-containing protein [Bacteroidales bacterium]